MSEKSDDASVEDNSSPQHDPNACQLCGNADIDPQYAFKLCETCRKALSTRPLPGWVRISLAIVAVSVVFAITRMDNSIKAGVAFQRGEAAEKNNDYATAVKEYRKTLEQYPNSVKVLARLGIVEFRNGNFEGAFDSLHRLKGKKLDRKLAHEVNEVVTNINAMLDSAEKKQ